MRTTNLATSESMTNPNDILRGMVKISEDYDNDGWWSSGEFLLSILDMETSGHTVTVYRGAAMIGTFEAEGHRFQEGIRKIIGRSLAKRPL